MDISKARFKQVERSFSRARSLTKRWPERGALSLSLSGVLRARLGNSDHTHTPNLQAAKARYAELKPTKKGPPRIPASVCSRPIAKKTQKKIPGNMIAGDKPCEHPDRRAVEPSPVPILIIANKYDAFMVDIRLASVFWTHPRIGRARCFLGGVSDTRPSAWSSPS